MEIKGDIQKDQVKDIQHQRQVCPAVWFRDMEDNQRNLQKTAVLRQRCLRSIMGIHWPEVIRNEELWKRAKQERIDTQIRRRKWGWIGHTLRKPTTNITRHALRWNPQGKRSQGRPRNSWRRTVDDEVGKAGYTWRELEKLTQNRSRWRAAASMDLCSTGSSRE